MNSKPVNVTVLQAPGLGTVATGVVSIVQAGFKSQSKRAKHEIENADLIHSRIFMLPGAYARPGSG